MTETQAEAALNGVGLVKGTVTTSYSDTVPAGLVISSTPPAGTSVAYGSSVDLEISLGHAPVTVPNVLSMTETQAEAVLNGAGLVKGTVTTSYSDTVPAGLVISSTPPAGTSVAYGSSVDLEISLGHAPVAVPDVLNMTESQAEAALNAAGLNKGAVTTSYSDTVPAGLVISSTPPAGTSVAYGSSVDLEISLGHAPVTVPNVLSMTETQAEATLNGAGLVKGTVTTSYSDTVPAGLVISSTPPAGTSVAYGSSVDLEISLGHAPVTVPNVLSMTETQAEATLNGAGLVKGTVTTSYSETVPAGLVISSTPPAGTPVAYGSSVDLEISLGHAPVAVPNVLNMTEAQAEAALNGAGLNKGTVTTSYSETVPVGLVISSTPPAGTSVAYGSSVDLEISLGHAPVTVPNVLSMTETQAEAALNGVGLVKGTVTTSYSETVPAGLVISSTPPAGTSVAYGSSVDLEISLGHAPVTVPNVLNMTEAQAEAALNGVGLNRGAVTASYSETVPVGLVISSTPPAGTSVAYGSSVDLVLSLGPYIGPRTYDWTNAYPWSQLWSSPQNWDPLGIPGPEDTANIDPATISPPADPTMGPAIDFSMTVQRINGPANNTGTQKMHITTGDIVVNSWGGINGDKGTVYARGDATVTVQTGEMRVADEGTFVLDLSENASFEVAGALRVGDTTDGAHELYVTDNASLIIGGEYNIGDDGDGLLNITGGLVQVNGSVNWECRESPAGVTLNVGGGQFIVGGTINADNANRNDADNQAIINLSGGAIGAGNINLPNDGEGRATLNMTGGLLVVSGALRVGHGTTVIHLDAGTLDLGELGRQGAFTMDIAGGVMILDGDQRRAIETDVDAGNITAYGNPSRGDILTDYDGLNPGRTTVWAEPHFGRTYGPNPPHKATGLGSRDNIVLSWLPGDGAVFHHIFFSDSYDDVLNEAWTCQLTGPGGQVETSIEVAAPFQLNTTYYWKVVEQDAHLGLVHGWVWNFTIEDGRVIDGMEEYSANPDYIYETWKDGCGYWVGDELVGNGTGSCVDLTMARMHSGAKAMFYSYENYLDVGWERDHNYSEAKCAFDAPQNWLLSGELALVVFFRGTATNASSSMWAVVNDGVVDAVATYGAYGDDPEDIKAEEWIDWNIKLSDLADAGADLTNVVSLALGFGDRDNNVEIPDCRGIVYFDDITLYPARCVPKYVTDIVDLNDDCLTDWGDIEVFAGQWLEDLR
ncbi:MAG: PASTA domain-containing protein [Planctomycetota bacterium]|jgi:beta-lactam-binding protein with PASTA domain